MDRLSHQSPGAPGLAFETWETTHPPQPYRLTSAFPPPYAASVSFTVTLRPSVVAMFTSASRLNRAMRPRSRSLMPGACRCSRGGPLAGRVNGRG